MISSSEKSGLRVKLLKAGLDRFGNTFALHNYSHRVAVSASGLVVTDKKDLSTDDVVAEPEHYISMGDTKIAIFVDQPDDLKTNRAMMKIGMTSLRYFTASENEDEVVEEVMTTLAESKKSKLISQGSVFGSFMNNYQPKEWDPESDDDTG